MGNGFFVGTFLMLVCFGVALGLGTQEANHGHYVELFDQNPKLEKEFGPINEYGTTDKFTAFLYDGCLSDPSCGS
jgi:hypothetical protein